MIISHFPKSPSEKGGHAQSTQFQHTDVSGRVGLTGPLEQLTLKFPFHPGHFCAIHFLEPKAHLSTVESLHTALDLCISLPAELNSVSAPAQLNS